MALDFMPEEKLRELQLQRLRATVKLAYEKVPLFHDRMVEKGVTPDDIDLEGHREDSVLHEEGLARHLSVRSLCR